MSIATGFAIAMAVAGASAAGATVANVVGAHSTAKAAKTAAEIQAASADKALAYTQQKDAQDRTDAMAAQKASYEQWAAKERRMAPYRAAGQGATQTIAPMLGLPAVDIPEPAPPPAFLSAPPLAPPAAQISTPQTATTPPPTPSRWTATATPPPTPVGTTPTGTTGVGTMAPLMAPRTVLMRAPTGQTKAVPEDQVSYYTAHGAQVVN